jgi:hypothetical protein
MFGCLGRIGCGFFLIVLGAAGWATKDRWWPEVRRRLPIEMPAVRSRGTVVVDAGGRVAGAIEAGRAGSGRAVRVAA